MQLCSRLVADADDSNVLQTRPRVQFGLNGSADGTMNSATQSSVGRHGDKQLLLGLLSDLAVLTDLSVLKIVQYETVCPVKPVLPQVSQKVVHFICSTS